MTAIEDMTLKEIRALLVEATRLGLNGSTTLAAPPSGDCFPFKLGDPLMIRAVTHYYTGRLVAFDALTIVLDEAAWIPDTGRYSDAVSTGLVGECEPIGTVAIGRGAVVDVVRIGGKLPKDRK